MYLVRYSELFLKSEPVRKRWEDMLIKNIERTGSKVIDRDRGRIFVDDSEKLTKIFGIQSFSPCKHCKLHELEDFFDFCDVERREVIRFARQKGRGS